MGVYCIVFVLFIVVYLRGLMEPIGLSDSLIKLVCEIPVLLLAVLTSLRLRMRVAPGGALVLLFVAFAFVSGECSGDGGRSAFLYSRSLVYTYVVFWAVWNTKLTMREVRRLCGLILSLWFVQVVVSVFRVLVLNERVEAHSGTITSGGGLPATVFPLFAMGYVMAAYCYKWRSLWLPVLALSFSLVGYASGKRAIYFLVPGVYGLVLIWYGIRVQSVRALAVIVPPLLVAILAFPLYLYGIGASKRIALQEEGASVTERIAYMIEMGLEYEQSERDGYTGGRTATTRNILERIRHGGATLQLVGLGPASLMGDQRAKDEMQFGYGQTGWATDAISIGVPGMLLHVAFFGSLAWRLARKAFRGMNADVQALQFGTQVALVVYFLMYFFYCDAFAMAGWMSYPLAFCLALLLSERHRSMLEADKPESGADSVQVDVVGADAGAAVCGNL